MAEDIEKSESLVVMTRISPLELIWNKMASHHSILAGMGDLVNKTDYERLWMEITTGKPGRLSIGLRKETS